MWRYLKAAFWEGVTVPGLGLLPVNLFAMLGVAVVGLVNPGIWLIGLGLETAFLFTVATNGRYRNVVDARDRQTERQGQDAEAKRQSIITELPDEARRRLAALEGTCAQTILIQRNSQAGAVVLDDSRDALQRVAWLYLKLLLARQRLLEQARLDAGTDLATRLAGLERELADPALGTALRASKSATHELLLKRQQNQARRGQALAEIDSDLARIEAQVDLARENATIQEQPTAVSTNLDLVSHLLDGSLYGASEDAVLDLDQTFQVPSAKPSQRAAVPQRDVRT